MKKVFLFVAVAFVSFIAKAQDNVVKVNPLGLVIGVFNVSYEKAINESGAIEVGANYFNWKNLDLSGMGGEVAYRIYFSKNNDAPEGIYGAPFINVNSMKYKYTTLDSNFIPVEKDDSAVGFGGGVKGGYQWIFDSGLALDLFFGYGYTSVKFDEAAYDYSGGVPRLGVALGYNF